MMTDPNSLLQQWADKNITKKKVKKKRKEQNQINSHTLWIFYLFAAEISGEAQQLKKYLIANFTKQSQPEPKSPQELKSQKNLLTGRK